MTYNTIEYLQLGPLHLRTWGLMVALGVIVGAALTMSLARRRGIPEDKVLNLALIVAGAGVLGSRVFWALQPAELGETLSRPWSLVAVWEGGLTFVGGLIFAVAAGVAYARRAGLPLAVTADLAACGTALGLAVGRIGCLLTGLHPGTVTTLPWGIDHLGAVRHPIPFYESLLAVLLLALGARLLARRLAPGSVALSLAVFYLVGRGLLDLLRDPGVAGADPRLFASLTLTQSIALLVGPAVAALLLARLRGGERSPA
jgi:phosphatidylglycerol---prolipoprotein diacylglyceryl transferase